MEVSLPSALTWAEQLNALLATLVIVLILVMGADDAALVALRADTSDKLARAERIKGEHARRLVAVYEPAMLDCLRGRGFVTDQAAVLCSVSRVSR